MTLEKLATEFATTLAGNGGSITSGATTFNVAAALPSGLVVPFRAVISAPGATIGEIVLVTAVTSLAWTVTRGQETTLGAPAAAAHNDGDNVAVVLTATGLGKVLADTTAPTTMAAGDAAASGSGPGLAFVDHKHGGPAGTLGYAQITANQTGITANVDITGLAVTVTVGSGRRIRVSCQARAQSTVADAGAAIIIQESTTLLAIGIVLHGNVNVDGSTFISVVLQPSAGSHTYKITCQNYVAGTAQFSAAGQWPAYILVEDIGT